MAERKVTVFTGADGKDYDVRDEEAQQSIITMGNKIGSVPSGKTLQGQIETLSNGIGSVPSGQTVEGQISALESGKVPTTRKVNNKALSSDITLVGTDIPVSSSDNTKVDSALASKVPNTRKVNNKALSSDVNLVGSDIPVSALDSTKLDVAITDLKSTIGTVPTGKTVQGQIDALENGLEKGTYEDLTAGNALYLLSDRGDTDVAPYVFRKTGGAKNGYGREFLRKIVGGTVAWNQLNDGSTGVYNGGGIHYEKTSDGKITITGTATSTDYWWAYRLSDVLNHVILCILDDLPSGVAISEFGSKSGIAKVTKLNPDGEKAFSFNVNVNAGTVNYSSYVMFFDLTQMFGSTIADAIYAMEQATAGSGVAWFRSLFPNSYYAYNAGSLQSVQAKEHRLTGFNQWDEDLVNGKFWATDGNNVLTQYSHAERSCTNNPIRVLPGETYYVKSPNLYRAFFGDKDNKKVSDSGWKDANTTVTVPANAVCMVITFNPNISTYNHDICINLSDPARNGEYEPYSGHTYPLDSSLILRGIPKLDSTNGLYYDGDEYKPDGSVKRKYGIVDLGTLEWRSHDSTNHIFKTSVSPSMITESDYPSRRNGFICSKYSNDTQYSISDSMHDKSVLHSGSDIFIRDNSYSDAATFETAMSGVYLVYELATPTTEQADGYRELQISAHGGTEEFVDAEVTATTPTRDVSIPVGTETFYPIDVVAYIEELTNPDHDMVADALIPSGKYFMVGNSLYLSTSQIQAGATIIPGSNCTAKTLAEALNELNT